MLEKMYKTLLLALAVVAVVIGAIVAPAIRCGTEGKSDGSTPHRSLTPAPSPHTAPDDVEEVKVTIARPGNPFARKSCGGCASLWRQLRSQAVYSCRTRVLGKEGEASAEFVRKFFGSVTRQTSVRGCGGGTLWSPGCQGGQRFNL